MLDFPNSPATNERYTIGSKSWVWNGIGWQQSGNYGQVGLAFVGLSVIHITVEEIPGDTLGVHPAWAVVNHI